MLQESDTPIPDTPEPPLHVFSSLLDAQARARPGAPVAIAVRVTSVRDVAGPADQPDAFPKAIFLQDVDRRRQIDVLPTTDLALVRIAEDALFSGVPVVAIGRFVSEARRRDTIKQRLQLEALRPAVSLPELIGASQEMRARARETIARLSGATGDSGRLERHLLEQLAAIHLVAQDPLSPRMRRCHRLVLLQALSDGQVGPGANPRLSLCFLSKPGQGKGVLARYAQSLAPVQSLVQPTLITPAGFSVRIEQKEGQGYTSDPGSLVRASQGVCVVHDIHRFRTRDLNTYQSLMMSVAEEAVVKPTKAADFPFQAQTALHLNGNFRHVMEGTEVPMGPRARLLDMGLPLDLFSRTDVVVAVGEEDDLEALAAELCRQRLHAEGPGPQAQRAEKEAELRALIAELRDQIPQVDLQPVEEAMTTALGQMIEVLHDCTAQLQGPDEAVFQAEALLLRGARTLRKLVGASARLDGRAAANEADVQCAVEMLAFKLEVVRWACGRRSTVQPQGSFRAQVRRAQVAREARGHRILETFGGMGPLTLAGMARALGVGQRTLERDLKGLKLRPDSEERYTIPTPLEYEKMQLEWERSGAPQPGRPEKDEDEEEEAAPQVAGQPYRFYDSLPKLPLGLLPVLSALVQLDGLQQYRAARTMCEAAVAPEITQELTYKVRAVDAVLRRKVEDYDGAAGEEMVKRVLDPDREKGAGIALSLYCSEAMCTIGESTLEDALGRADLPLGVRRHIESALLRRKFIDQNPHLRFT
jgi:hypothetical protein